jgi:arylsulfatase A
MGSMFCCDRYRWVLACAVVGVLLLEGTVCTANRTQPNIVFILADDVGADAIGCYGGTTFPTPNIDRLAQSGMRFDYAFAMPVCHPTRVCFLTGRYPRHIGNPAWGSFPEQLEEQTIASVLRRVGYKTVVAGKWQLAMLGQDLQQPHRMGFDEYCLFGWHEGPRYHDPLIYQNGSQLHGTEGKYGPDLYVEFLTDFFRRHQQEPFFAFYSMALCHDVTDDLGHPVPYVPGKQRYLNYAEMARSMDECVGRIVDSLEQLGLRERTWIVFTGDNGTASGSIIRAEPTETEGKNGWRYVRDPVVVQWRGRQIRGGKGTLNDSGTHVPLIVSRPGVLPAGQAVDDLVDMSDYFATFAMLGGASLPQNLNLDSVSFAPRLLGKGRNAREWACAESKNAKGAYWVRTQRFKLYSDGRFVDMAHSDRDRETAISEQQLSSQAAAVRPSLEAALRSIE